MKMRPFIVVLLVIALGGCGHVPTPFQAYSGDPRSIAEVAVVFVAHTAFWSTPPNRHVRSFAVDEKDLGRIDPLVDLRGHLMALTPGRHTLGIALGKGLSVSSGTVTTEVITYTVDVELKAGLLYALCPSPNGGVFLRELAATPTATASVEQWQQTAASACK